MSRHADRQALARGFGATDIVTERGDEGVAKIKELTGGYGAHSTVEAVGTQESMLQAIHSNEGRRWRVRRRRSHDSRPRGHDGVSPDRDATAAPCPADHKPKPTQHPARQRHQQR